MAYDAYLYRSNGQLANEKPVFRLEESDYGLLLRVLARRPSCFPILRRLEDYYRDAVIAGSEAEILQGELELVRAFDPDLAKSLGALLSVVQAAQAEHLNVYFVAD